MRLHRITELERAPRKYDSGITTLEKQERKTIEKIETAKTPFSTPENWKPKKFEFDKTPDEPYSKIKPLVEGNTYVFRSRGRNSTGYGGYSEVWMVEIAQFHIKGR